MKRRKLTDEQRKRIYTKYKGRCAYCGCKIKMNQMEVDHIQPLSKGGSDIFDNMNPSCRMCNRYKNSTSLLAFRNLMLGRLLANLNKHFTYRVAVKYGMIEEREWDRKFYFEKVNK